MRAFGGNRRNQSRNAPNERPDVEDLNAQTARATANPARQSGDAAPGGHASEGRAAPGGRWQSDGPAEPRQQPPPRRFGLCLGAPSQKPADGDGTILVCVALADLGRPPRAGDRLVGRRGTINGVTMHEFVFPEGIAAIFEEFEAVALVVGRYRPE